MKTRNRFKELWIEHDMIPLKDIAEATQIHRVTLSKIKNNPYYNISLKDIDKLCEFFQCEPGDLIVSDNGDRPQSKDEDPFDIFLKEMESLSEKEQRVVKEMVQKLALALVNTG